YPQTADRKAKILVKMTANNSHNVTVDGNKLYIDVKGSASAGDTLLAPAAAAKPAPAPAQVETPPPALLTAEPKAVEAKPTPVTTPQVAKESEAPKPVAPKMEVPAPAAPVASATPATEVKDVRVDQNDVILVGNGAFQYDAFELSNPQR